MQGANSCASITNWNRLKVLGKGSYGIVFLAVPIIKRPCFVALKVASIKHCSSLMKEKTILQNFIGCPEIVQCIGSEFSFEGKYFHLVFYNLVLEYAGGGTLTNLISQRQRLSESEVKEYLRMLLKGLCCIQDGGFVHGDLKPDNILVFPNNDGKMQLKITDFGLSKRCDDEEVECCNNNNVKPKFRGTPRYMSPESVRFGNINTWLDIWSLGCILIEMVCGKWVWSDCQNQQLMIKLVLLRQNLDIPKELSRQERDFLARCLDRNYERRWTAKMLLQHPYVKEEEKVDEIMPFISNLPNLTRYGRN